MRNGARNEGSTAALHRLGSVMREAMSAAVSDDPAKAAMAIRTRCDARDIRALRAMQKTRLKLIARMPRNA
jgi:hypothetical protein